MKHRVAGRKLGRTSAHRLALLRNLSTALFERERIRTTLSKAKELRPFAERLLTLSKRETLHARRMVLRHIHDRKVVGKLFDALSARYAQRPGGYTRILKLGPRRGDNAEMAIIELVGAEEAQAAAKTSEESAKTAAPTKGRRKKKGAEAEAEGAAPETPKRHKTEAPARKKAPTKKAAGAKAAPPPKKKGQTAVKRGSSKSGGGS
jgi:large subunit ribosomal protein L17